VVVQFENELRLRDETCAAGLTLHDDASAAQSARDQA